MTQMIDKDLSLRSPEPLHHILLSLGRSWLGAKPKEPRSRVSHIKMDQRYDLGAMLLTERNRDMTIMQLATSLRMQGIDDDSSAMLGMLESLAAAGEITFSDYINRAQNLFPRMLDRLDPSLRVKISALLVND